MDSNENSNSQLKTLTNKFKNKKSKCSSSVIKMVQPSLYNRNKTSENEAQVRTFNFMDSFRPVYYFSRIFGLMPFSIICDDTNGEVQQSKITKFDGLWFVISLCFPSLMGYFVQASIKPQLIFLLDYVFEISAFIYWILSIVVNMFYRSRFINILKKITTFDEEVRIPNVASIIITIPNIL